MVPVRARNTRASRSQFQQNILVPGHSRTIEVSHLRRNGSSLGNSSRASIQMKTRCSRPIVIISNSSTSGALRRLPPNVISLLRNISHRSFGMFHLLTSCFRIAPIMWVVVWSSRARKSQYKLATATSPSGMRSRRLSTTMELVFLAVSGIRFFHTIRPLPQICFAHSWIPGAKQEGSTFTTPPLPKLARFQKPTSDTIKSTCPQALMSPFGL